VCYEKDQQGDMSYNSCQNSSVLPRRSVTLHKNNKLESADLFLHTLFGDVQERRPKNFCQSLSLMFARIARELSSPT
jgi:hypothetical protein